MNIRFLILYILFLITPGFAVTLCASDDEVLAILESELKHSKGSDRFYLLIELSELNNEQSIDKSIKYGQQALDVAIEREDRLMEARALENLGTINIKRQEWSEAINFLVRSKEIYTELENKKQIVEVLIRIADIYQEVNDFEKSEKFLKEAFLFISDSTDIARFHARFGYVNYKLNNFETALKYYGLARSYYQRKSFYFKGVKMVEYIGLLYHDWGKFDEALRFYKMSLDLYVKLNDRIEMLNAHYNIAETYYNSGQYDSSIIQLREAVVLSRQFNEKEITSKIYQLFGHIYKSKGMLLQSVEEYKKSMSLAEESNNNKVIIQNYESLYLVYSELQDYKKALEYYTNFNTVKEFYQESSDLVSDMETKYAIERNERKIEMMDKDKKMEDIRKTNMIRIFAVGVSLLLIIILLIYRQSVQRQRTNTVLEQQKKEILKINEELKQQSEEIMTQKEMLQEAYGTIEIKSNMLEQTNMELLDNIRYAKRIQGSILPQERYISSLLPEHFIYFRPRDILSGDFYWVQEYPPVTAQNPVPTNYLVAAVDCTGHGVSGALLSIVGNNLLNQALFEHHLSKPSEILDFMHREVFYIWEHTQVESEIKVNDGMDMALINYNPNEMTVQYAGAKNPMFLIRDKELTIYKATKQAIGENPYTNRSTYENNEIKVQKGDLLYLFSDGYADQFGGEENKKFKDIRFWKMLIAICDKPMDEQKQIIHETLEQWKGSNEQVDDILVIGIRIV